MEEISIKDIDKINLKGKVIAFPTDTVYGVGALIDDLDAIHKIYELKHRDYHKPLAILIGSFDIDKYVLNNNGLAKEITNKYWPGALTVIYKKKDTINDLISANLDTVGLRMPNSKIALTLLKHFGPLATTSVNISGSTPLNNKKDIIENFDGLIDYIISEEEGSSNVSSSVIEVKEDGKINVIRAGEIKL